MWWLVAWSLVVARVRGDEVWVRMRSRTLGRSTAYMSGGCCRLAVGQHEISNVVCVDVRGSGYGERRVVRRPRYDLRQNLANISARST